MSIVLLGMAKQAYTEYRRMKQDRETNNKKSSVFSRKDLIFKETYWKDIKVGDIVMIETKT